jgi:hypothetical protein
MSSLTPPDEAIKAYIDTFDERERVAYEIAKHHLESSFDIVRSIGFQEFYKDWIKQQSQNQEVKKSG